MEQLIIKTPKRTYSVPEGRPVIVQWNAKHKGRTGSGMALGWIKRGENPHCITLVHSTFQSWDRLAQGYPAKWTIWKSQITDIRILRREKTDD